MTLSGLDVAVDDLRGVRDRHRLCHLPRDSDDARERQPLRRQVTQRRSFDQLHRDVAVGADDPGLVDGDDVGVVERRGQRGFPQQAVERRVILGHHAPDDFQRDFAAEPRIERAIHLAHASGAEVDPDFIGPELGTRSQVQWGGKCHSLLGTGNPISRFGQTGNYPAAANRRSVSLLKSTQSP
jgi:hypothetical protein